MDRKAAVATSLAVVLGIGAAVFALASNVGAVGSKGNVGKLTQNSAALTATADPSTVTVTVTPTPAAPTGSNDGQAPPAVQYVDTTITVPAARSSGVRSATSTQHHDDGAERDD